MPSLHPDPGFDYYYKACKKGDSEAKAVALNESPVAALADASEITGLPRDNFEIHEISKEEFERMRSWSLASKEAVGIRVLLQRLLFGAALANASEITGLPRDNFEIHEISKKEFERHRV